jgi:hypothetical protein
MDASFTGPVIGRREMQLLFTCFIIRVKELKMFFPSSLAFVAVAQAFIPGTLSRGGPQGSNEWWRYDNAKGSSPQCFVVSGTLNQMFTHCCMLTSDVIGFQLSLSGTQWHVWKQFPAMTRGAASQQQPDGWTHTLLWHGLEGNFVIHFVATVFLALQEHQPSMHERGYRTSDFLPSKGKNHWS